MINCLCRFHISSVVQNYFLFISFLLIFLCVYYMTPLSLKKLRISRSNFPMPAQVDIAALGKAHARSAPSPSSLVKVALETEVTLLLLNTNSSCPRTVERRPPHFTTRPSFRWSVLWRSCPPVLRRFLPFKAVDKSWCLLCMLVCLSVLRLWPWHGQGDRSSVVFAAKENVKNVEENI